MYKAQVKVPGSCGELAQGLLDNTNMMVTCPINLFSKVSVFLSKNFSGVETNIEAKKTVIAVEKLLAYLHKKELGAKVNLNSQLIRSKGMASSTADIAGAMAAVMIALNYELDLQLIKKIALEIEPTDGIFLPGINFFDHISGKYIAKIGEPPALDILMFSEQGAMDTLSFNKTEGLKEKKRAKEKLVTKAFAYIKKGIQLQNKKMIGKGATISTIAHQHILYKSYLKKVIRMTENIPDVYGINNAHSGKLIGLIVNREKKFNKLISNIENEISILNYAQRVNIISGGIRFLEGGNEYGSYSWRKYRTGTSEI